MTGLEYSWKVTAFFAIRHILRGSTYLDWLPRYQRNFELLQQQDRNIPEVLPHWQPTLYVHFFCDPPLPPLNLHDLANPTGTNYCFCGYLLLKITGVRGQVSTRSQLRRVPCLVVAKVVS